MVYNKFKIHLCGPWISFLEFKTKNPEVIGQMAPNKGSSVLRHLNILPLPSGIPSVLNGCTLSHSIHRPLPTPQNRKWGTIYLCHWHFHQSSSSAPPRTCPILLTNPSLHLRIKHLPKLVFLPWNPGSLNDFFWPIQYGKPDAQTLRIGFKGSGSFCFLSLTNQPSKEGQLPTREHQGNRKPKSDS